MKICSWCQGDIGPTSIRAHVEVFTQGNVHTGDAYFCGPYHMDHWKASLGRRLKVCNGPLPLELTEEELAASRPKLSGYQLHVSEEQTNVLRDACELYARIGMG